MYPYIRAIHLILAARKLPKMGVLDTHVSHHRAWPLDTDIFGELNNGRILTLFELGRWAATMRLGLFDVLRKEKIAFPVAGASVTYRKRVPVMARYEMRTRFIGWDDKFFYADQAMWLDETCANQLMLRAAVKSRGRRISPDDFMALAGLDDTRPDLPNWVQEWITSDAIRPWPPVSDA